MKKTKFVTLPMVQIGTSDTFEFVNIVGRQAIRAPVEDIRTEACPDEHEQVHEDIDLALYLAGHGLHITYIPAMVTEISALDVGLIVQGKDRLPSRGPALQDRQRLLQRQVTAAFGNVAARAWELSAVLLVSPRAQGFRRSRGVRPTMGW